MEITIKGKPYKVEMNLWAMEQIEEQFGGIQAMFQAISSGKRMMWSAVEILRILINAPIVREAVETNTKPDLLSHAYIASNLRGADLEAIKGIVSATTTEGMHSRMKDPDMDDEVHDAVLEAIEKKETAE